MYAEMQGMQPRRETFLDKVTFDSSGLVTSETSSQAALRARSAGRPTHLNTSLGYMVPVGTGCTRGRF